jgi:hypothetical protein
MSGSVIKKCNCKPNPSSAAEYQDSKYGSGNRVCNLDQKKTEATCTVCNKSHKL